MALYPSIAQNYSAQMDLKQTQEYETSAGKLEQDEISRLMQEAKTYNEELAELENPMEGSEALHKRYQSVLDSGTGSMAGVLEIDSIDLSLPIYLSENASDLAAGACHLEGTSLPIGGKGTHCVLTGHSGMANKTLFTNLDQLQTGDTFSIEVLDETLEYQVDQITVCTPDEVFSYISIDPDQDYVTLMTCTPYGINDKRLLVRGVRIENMAAETAETADTVQKQSFASSQTFWLLLSCILLLAVYLIGKLKKRFA
jgi:sortase A